jgi:hypothetical protein
MRIENQTKTSTKNAVQEFHLWLINARLYGLNAPAAPNGSKIFAYFLLYNIKGGFVVISSGYFDRFLFLKDNWPIFTQILAEGISTMGV